MVTILLGSGKPKDQDPLKDILFVPKDDLSKPNPNTLEKVHSYIDCNHSDFKQLSLLQASPLVRPEEFVEYQLRVYTKRRGLKKKTVKEYFKLS